MIQNGYVDNWKNKIWPLCECKFVCFTYGFDNNPNILPIAILNNNYDEDDKYYYAKKSKRDNVIGPWLPCELLEKVGNGDGTTGYIVQFIRSQEKKDIAEYELAYRTVPTNELYIGTRVIARRCRDLLPYQINQTGQKNNLLDSNDAEFYPGIITGADTATNRYLTFFDDGMVQLIALNDIRRVVGNDSCNHGMRT